MQIAIASCSSRVSLSQVLSLYVQLSQVQLTLSLLLFLLGGFQRAIQAKLGPPSKRSAQTTLWLPPLLSTTIHSTARAVFLCFTPPLFFPRLVARTHCLLLEMTGRDMHALAHYSSNSCPPPRILSHNSLVYLNGGNNLMYRIVRSHARRHLHPSEPTCSEVTKLYSTGHLAKPT